MSEKRLLTLILTAFVALGTIYALITPVFEASDELWHYPMIRHLADGNPLPVQVFDPAQAGPWKQEASQPPLYYYVGAALTFWIDTSDMEEVRRLNPHVDNGVVTADRNINLVVHDPTLSPWQGTLLAVRIVRLASVLMGAVTVYFTHKIAREVAPQRAEIALGAAAINAFIPMFLFISGAVNNDNLAIMLASMALTMMVRLVRQQRRLAQTADNGDQLSLKPWLALGVVIGLAALTKEGTLGLIPLLAGTAAIAVWVRLTDYREEAVGSARRRPNMALFVRVGTGALKLTAIALLPVVLIAGWWYARNVVLYGDWLGWNAFIAVLGQRPQPASLAQLWDERWGFLASYWGLFGGVNVPMQDWIYNVLNVLPVIALFGLAVYGWGVVRSWQPEVTVRPQGFAATAFQGLKTLFDFVAAHFALVVCVLFSAAVLYGLVSWATTTWSSQGRLAFTAISALSTLLAVGLYGWLPGRAAQITAGAIAAFLFLVAVAAPFLWIKPAYEPQAAEPPAPLEDANFVFGEKMALVGYAIARAEPLQPGDTLDVYLAWRVLAPLSRDWSVFVHLNDPVLDTPLAQRDMYPGGGLVATSFLEPGDELVDHLRLRVPQTAPAPAMLDLVVGLYDFQTHERLSTRGGEIAHLAEVMLEPRADDEAGDQDVNFGNQIALDGFEIAPRRLAAGETIELATRWKALRTLEQDYTLFAQLLGESGTTRWAAIDLPMQTSAWQVGDVHAVDMPLTVDTETPPGVYTLIVGAYTRDAGGGFSRLQIVREGRITMDDALQLTRIRID